MVGGGGAARVRVLVSGAPREGDVVPLDDDEVHHLRVRRAAEGEAVELRNGEGLSGTGLLVSGAGGWGVQVVSVGVAVPGPQLLLAVAAGDRDRFAWMVEKLGELGATDVVPLETALSVTVASRIRAGQIEKLRRRALESTKQSGARWALRVHDVLSLEELARSVAGDREATRWLADAEGEAPLVSLDGAQFVAVGPEGGFTAEERAALVGAGWQPVRLGAHTLRFETAAIAAAAWIAGARERRPR